MGKGHFVFESALIGITVILGLFALTSPQTVIWLALWMIPLGFTQMVHAVDITTRHWSSPLFAPVCSFTGAWQ